MDSHFCYAKVVEKNNKFIFGFICPILPSHNQTGTVDFVGSKSNNKKIEEFETRLLEKNWIKINDKTYVNCAKIVAASVDERGDLHISFKKDNIHFYSRKFYSNILSIMRNKISNINELNSLNF